MQPIEFSIAIYNYKNHSILTLNEKFYIDPTMYDDNAILTDNKGNKLEFNTIEEAQVYIDKIEVSAINKTSYICTLPQYQQQIIKNHLLSLIGTDEENLQNMLDGRICDMEDCFTFQELQEMIKLHPIICQLMENDKNATWYEVKTIKHMKECLLSAMEGGEEVEGYLLYKEMLLQL